MTALPDFRLESFLAGWEFKARFHMCASDMESMPMHELVAMANAEDRARWDELRLGYIETFGTPALREAIADTYENIDAGSVLAFAGAEEGLYAAMRVLLDRDDHAIVITPNYQSAETLPGAICAVTGVGLDPDDDWNLDLDRVRAALRPNTRLISINFPHNPTGKIIAQDDYAALIAIAREHGIYVFSDEVYRLLERDDAKRLPQAADIYEKGLSLNVMSKAYGLPGLRIGWIATRDRGLLERMERVKHYLSICNSAPGECLATIALHSRDRILARNRDIVVRNLRTLNAFFAAHSDLFAWREPDGGCIGYPRYLGTDGVEAFCERLVNEAGVLLLPASVYRSDFGPSPADHFRIGFGRADMAQGLDAMREFIDGDRG